VRVNFVAPLCRTGVGLHAQNILAELLKLEREGTFEISVHPIGPVQHSVSAEVTEAVSAKLMRQKSFDEADLTVAFRLPQSYVRAQMPRARRQVCLTVFETDFFPGLQNLREADEVWVPTEWGREVLFNLSVDRPVRVVPEGVSHIRLERPPRQEETLRILNVGKFEKRKGHLLLLDLLPKLGRPVRLDAWWDNPWDRAGAHHALCQRGFEKLSYVRDLFDDYQKGDSHVRLWRPFDSQSALLYEMSTADLAIFPHYGEGWGLPILESIALGIPTLASAHTGSEDYMESYRSVLCQRNVGLETSLFEARREPASDGIFFRPEAHGQWLAPDPEELLKRTLELIPAALDPEQRQRFAQAGYLMGLDYSWRSAAEEFIRTCHQLE